MASSIVENVTNADVSSEEMNQEQQRVLEEQKARVAATDKDTLLKLLYQMILIRRFEEKCAESYSLGKIGGFCHLYIGQEAVAVGAISALRPDDYVLTSYREHGHAIAKGISPNAVMAELYGKAEKAARCTCSTRV
jgi:pyruvate dehydrogenase E1 component alpha subunit